MCGLSGVMSCFLTPQELRDFQDLMTLSMLRGRQGSGIVVVPTNRKRDIQLLHSENTSDALVHGPLFEAALKKAATPSIVMGHARFPTKGGNTLDDVHPHVSGNKQIIGMHNGTITEMFGAKLDAKESDSKLFFENVARHGIEKTVNNTVGAYACVWIDKSNSSLNFLRNSQRPLFFGYDASEGRTTVYWSSEAEMLHFVLKRNSCAQNPDIQIVRLPINKMFTFDLRLENAPIYPRSQTEILDKETLDVKNKAEPKTSVPSTITEPILPFKNGPSAAANAGTNDNKSGTSGWVQHCGALEHIENVRSWLNQGCGGCGNPLSELEYHQRKLYWHTRQIPICEDCQDDPFIVQFYRIPSRGNRK